MKILKRNSMLLKILYSNRKGLKILTQVFYKIYYQLKYLSADVSSPKKNETAQLYHYILIRKNF